MRVVITFILIAISLALGGCFDHQQSVYAETACSPSTAQVGTPPASQNRRFA